MYSTNVLNLRKGFCDTKVTYYSKYLQVEPVGRPQPNLMAQPLKTSTLHNQNKNNNKANRRSLSFVVCVHIPIFDDIPFLAPLTQTTHIYIYILKNMQITPFTYSHTYIYKIYMAIKHTSNKGSSSSLVRRRGAF